MEPQEVAFWLALYRQQSPANFLVFADWLEDDNQHDLAFALRWAQRNGRFPLPYYDISDYLLWTNYGTHINLLSHTLYEELISTINHAETQFVEKKLANVKSKKVVKFIWVPFLRLSKALKALDYERLQL